MKKVALLLVFTVMASVLSADNIQDEILGRWSAEPYLIERNDGLIVVPEAEYSRPYLGITRINFIDESFIVFTVTDVEHRAFYEVESLDFDNFNINCSFKGGEEFLLKLVRVPGGDWRYLYRIAEDSVFNGMPTEDEAPMLKDAEDGMLKDAEADIPEMNTEQEEVEVVYSIYTGMMKR